MGEAANGDEAVRLVEEHAPDVVLMDLEMPGKRGIDATREIAAAAPLTRVVVLTISDGDADVMDAVIAGACGYLLKDASIQELLRGIAAASRGESLISPYDRGEGAPAAAGDQPGRGSRRDADGAAVRPRASGAEAVANGKDNAEIARDLFISAKTVKNHISNILLKLSIENRIQAAVYAVRSGLA